MSILELINSKILSYLDKSNWDDMDALSQIYQRICIQNHSNNFTQILLMEIKNELEKDVFDLYKIECLSKVYQRITISKG